MTLSESAVAEVRRSSSATSPEAVFGRRPASAHRPCVTMARIMSRCDMAACCKFGRRSNGAAEIIPCCNARTAERAPLQAAQLRGACPLRKQQGTQLANCARRDRSPTQVATFTKRSIPIDDPVYYAKIA